MINDSFDNVNQIYYHSLKELKTKGVSVNSICDKNSIGSFFGNKSRDFTEIQGYSFILENSRNRLIYSENRQVSFGFNIANFIWFLSGSKSVEDIIFYNKKGKVFSDDGIYYEASFGDRIFGSSRLINLAISLLTSDRSSRRALLPLFFPIDLQNLPKDTPCASSIQFMIRNEKLDFFLHMRSQSVIMVFPYDIFLFTMLHEYLSLIFELELGKFYYYANSFHYYNDEEALLNKILEEQIYNPEPMATMPKSTINELNLIFNFEKYIRKQVSSSTEIHNEEFKIFSEYWQNLMSLVHIKAIIENNGIMSSISNSHIPNNIFI